MSETTQTTSNETARIEAFSDGIFSIAATLLVLQVKLPDPTQPLWRGLLQQWPGFASLVLSFFFIGIMWINHHRLFVHIRKADDLLMAVNLLLLLGVVFVPYPTALMATAIHHTSPNSLRDIAIFYNLGYLVIALFYNLLWQVCQRRDLLDHEGHHEFIHATTNQYRIGPLAYALCLAAAWVNVPLSLTMNAALAVWFLVPPKHPPHED